MGKPDIDIIIPSKDQPLFLIRCVQSLRGQARLGKIIVVDDGSKEETKEATKNLDGVASYYNAISEGFIKSVNRGVKKSDAPYVLILNSDTEIMQGAIEAMANNLDDGAAVCGALLLYPQNHPDVYRRGRIQHCGVGFSYDGIPYHVFDMFHPQSPAVKTWRSINAVTGAALMTKREVWDKIGGFDNKFAPAIYEDISYCLSVKAMKMEVVYEPKAVMYHYQHGSQTQGSTWFTRERLDQNLATLFLKHGRLLNDDHLFYKVRQ